MVSSIIEKQGALLLLLDAQNRALLLLRDDLPAWCLPGGALEPGETHRQGLQRELEEELGLVLPQDERRVTALASYTFTKPASGSRYTGVMFFMAYRNEPLSLGDEGVGFAFFSLDQLPSNMFRSQAALLQEAINHQPRQEPIQMIYTASTTSEADLIALSRPDFVGLDDWLSHPRVVAKRQAGNLRFDLKPG